MIADLNVHWDMGADGMPKPHAHVMLTMRSVNPDSFGSKVRDWNRTELVERWRERWADHVNERLAELDINARIDHRSLEAQGIDLEPQTKIGAPAQRIEAAGQEADHAEDHRRIARENGARIVADPSSALDAITRQQSTFTRRDMAMFAHRHSDGIDQFNAVMGAMRSAPDLVELGEERFTTRDMIEAEQRLHRAAAMMAERERHEVNDAGRRAALARAESCGLVLSGAQADALAHVTDGRDLDIVVGYAGTGKSAMLGVAREAWEDTGYTVRGAALSGIAAENLEGGSGIASRMIASMEHGWAQGRDMLTSRDAMKLAWSARGSWSAYCPMPPTLARKSCWSAIRSKLQSIEAGAAFRSIFERHGGVEIGEVRRQREDWQRNATRDLATGRTGDAIHAYNAHGMVHDAASREQARGDLIDRWDRDRQANPDASRIILTYTNDEVRALNEAARGRMRNAGELGADVHVAAERGARNFASGDRIMFLKNERELGVKNGTLGIIEQVSTQNMTVRTDDGRHVAFDLKDYNRIDHGYAATIHKAQGMTVDRTMFLATPGKDAHGSYVALSRHRESLDLHYGRNDFADKNRLIRTLSRDRAKDMASDYEPARDYAERRGITFRERVERVVEIVKQVPEKVRGMFDGLRLPAAGRQGPERKVEEVPETVLRRACGRALVRHARAVNAIFEAQERGGRVSPEQVTELQESCMAFEEVRPYGSHDAEAAYKKSPELAAEAASGDARRAIRALQLETELRTDPGLSADRFVERWQNLHRASDERYAAGDYAGHRAVRAEMGDMAKSLERDPQMESLLASRKRELGISFDSGMGVGRDLSLTFGLGRGRGLGL